MHIINIHHLTVNYAGREIFNDLTWVIGNRDRVGLVGPNGSGKSSLLKAITGFVTPDSGEIIKMRGVTVGYLHQDVEVPQGMTLINTTLVPPPRLAQVEAEISNLEDRLGDPAVYGDEECLNETMEQLELATLLYDRLDGA